MKTPQDLFDLTGKIAIVTGAGSGLGVVFAQALAEAGAGVVCADLRLDGAEETARSIEELGRPALAVETDVTDEAAVQSMVQTTLDRFGRIDILVNNAGIGVGGSPEETTLADWQAAVNVNLTGVFICAREVGKAMIAAGTGGRIINIASILGAVASEPAPVTAYAATKGAVINLTRDLAVHWAPHGILVNALGPAYFPSAMTGDALAMPEVMAEIERRTPLGRVGRLEELKGPVVLLASDAGSYITGQTLFVDGGWTAW
ncbi:MAG TPA: SDR family oxidoreductase [Thermomicrobiales bacterium]|nr:SDR family oxidoreductase [Thermomicrobiales bacterium]